MSNKFTYFRHSVTASDDPKVREFETLLGRRSREAYGYYWKLIELCASVSEDGQCDFKIHEQTLRAKWDVNTKMAREICVHLDKSSLVTNSALTNHVVFHLPNLPKYLGSYIANKERNKRKKENKEITAEPAKQLSPLCFLFNETEIKDWLNAGTFETHSLLLNKYSHHELADLIEKAFAWAKPRGIKAETWLYTFVSNKTTQGYGANKRHKAVSRATPGNPTGNPYLNDDGSLKSEGA